MLIFIISCLSAQDLEKLKKFEAKMQSEKNVKKKIKGFVTLANNYQHLDNSKTIEFARMGILLAENNNLDTLKANCYYYLASGFLLTGKSDSAIYFFTLEKNIREVTKDTNGLAHCLRKIGDCFYQQGHHVKAVKNYLGALRLWDELKKFDKTADTYVDLGNVYYSQSKPDKALQYYFSASEMYLKANDSISADIIKINIAAIYLDRNKIKECKLIMESIKEKNVMEYPQIEIRHGYLVNFAMLMVKLNDFKSSENILKKASVYYSENANSIVKLNHSNALSEFYLAVKNYRTAKDWSEMLIKYAEEIGSDAHHKAGLNYLAKSNAGLNNYKAAYENFEAFDKIKDTLLSHENRKQVLEMESEFQFEKKELENKSLKAEAKVKDAELEKSISDKKRQNILTTAFAFGLLLSAAFLFLVFRNLQQNKKKNKIITVQKAEVENAYGRLNEKNQEVLSSIHYAKRIQQALMTSEKNIERMINKTHQK